MTAPSKHSPRSSKLLQAENGRARTRRRRNRRPGWSPPITVTMHLRRSKACFAGGSKSLLPSRSVDPVTAIISIPEQRVRETPSNVPSKQCKSPANSASPSKLSPRRK